MSYNYYINKMLGENGWGEIKLYKKDGTLIDHVKMENTGCEYGEYC